MSDEPVVVHEYDDLVDAGVPPRDCDTLLSQLRVDRTAQGDDGFVGRVPDWLIEEKDISPVRRRTNVVVGRIDHETEKAWLVVYDGAEAWLPNSVATRFVPGRDADLSSPQQTLDALGGDA